MTDTNGCADERLESWCWSWKKFVVVGSFLRHLETSFQASSPPQSKFTGEWKKLCLGEESKTRDVFFL
jgi:hypothetical protein